jgi:DNA polymerase-3 subunit delta
MKPKNVDVFLKALPPDVRAVLFYGPDEGLVRERAANLALRIVPDINDPFNVVELMPARLAEDPARLADELSAQSLMGGRRLVRIRQAPDTVAHAVQNAFGQLPPGDSFLLIEAGDLRPSSALRKLFEGADVAAALPCYESDARDRVRLAEEEFKSAGIMASRDALQLLAGLLAGDRGVARQEIEKLIIYAGPKGRLEYEDIVQAIGDSATLELDVPAMAMADGNPAAVDRALTRLFADGTASIGVVRACIRHFQRLYQVVGSPDPLPVAIDNLKPPVFWKDKERFAAQAGRWKRAHLERALRRLSELEVQCKTSGLRDETMCARALITIASAMNPKGRAA